MTALCLSLFFVLSARAASPPTEEDADRALTQVQEATWALPALLDATEKGDRTARSRLEDAGAAMLALHRDATRGADTFIRSPDAAVRGAARRRRGAMDGVEEQLARARRRAVAVLEIRAAQGPSLTFFDPRFLKPDDPTTYERAAYVQKSTDACAVALQLIVLRAHGLVPAGDPAALEAALMSESRALGYVGDGTLPERATSLLTDRGLTLIKRESVHWRELESLLLGGGVAQVGVDGARLHGRRPKRPSPHSVLLVGAEKDGEGRVVSVRLIDPARGVLSVPAKRLQRAWLGDYAAIR